MSHISEDIPTGNLSGPHVPLLSEKQELPSIPRRASHASWYRGSLHGLFPISFQRTARKKTYLPLLYLLSKCLGKTIVKFWQCPQCLLAILVA